MFVDVFNVLYLIVKDAFIHFHIFLSYFFPIWIWIYAFVCFTKSNLHVLTFFFFFSYTRNNVFYCSRMILYYVARIFCLCRGAKKFAHISLQCLFLLFWNFSSLCLFENSEAQWREYLRQSLDHKRWSRVFESSSLSCHYCALSNTIETRSNGQSYCFLTFFWNSRTS